MKKTISLVLVFAFIFTLALQFPVLAEDNLGTTTETIKITTTTPPTLTSSTLEKISSPALINLYNQIKKIGNDLFGVRKATSTIANIQKNDAKKATSTPNGLEKKIEELKKAGLEKITSLDQVKLYDKITKVGKDLFGLKKIIANKNLPVLSADALTCVSAAIDAKDSSINISLTNSVTEITAAIDARGVCQKAALALSTGREDALKVCNKAFQEATKKANNTAKTSQKNTWETYKASLKTCATTASTTEITIEDGGDILK
jgi:hypothetical protein